METAYTTLKGSISGYDVIVIGHLKYNSYFGENASAPPRGDPSTCTSVMIRGDGYVLIVDPTLRVTPKEYYFDINRRTGLQANDVTHCFITHHHFDHQAGVNYFPSAVWCAAPSVAALLQSSKFIDGSRVKPVDGEFLPGIQTVNLPGHTRSLHGLAFMAEGRRILVAADSVMTASHFREETGMFEEDAEQARQTIQRIKRCAEVIIPGHDNIILNTNK